MSPHVTSTGALRLVTDADNDVWTSQLDVRANLKTALQGIRGIEALRFLSKDRRYKGASHKLFVMLATHDVDRDFQIVERLCQFDDIDYDMVPCDAHLMVPAEARPF